MKTARQACVPRTATFDPARRNTVLDLSHLVADQIDAASFFAENHVTEGMRTLLTEAFRRLEGKSTQGVFKLTQAMGGGKTHNLLALGLLARQPELRADVMGGFYRPDDIGPVRVVAFSGRESDAAFGVWGAIAEQLGRRDQFSDYYSPLSAPGQSALGEPAPGRPARHHAGRAAAVLRQRRLEEYRQLRSLGGHSDGPRQPPGRRRTERIVQRLCRDVRSHRVVRGR